MTPGARHLGVLLLASSMGCVSLGKPWGLARPSRNERPELLEQDLDLPEEETQEEVASEREPLIADGALQTPAHRDPSTSRLIELELRDASPEERKEWLAALEGVDDAQVPYILRARRLQLNREPQQPTESRTPSSEVLPAGHATTDSASSEGVVPLPAIARSERTDESAPADPESADLGKENTWSRRFLSLADPSWLKTHPPAETNPDSTVAPAKAERSPFGLPQIMGGHPRTDVPPSAEKGEAAAPPAARDPSTASNLRVTPGSALWEDEMHKLISLLESEASATADSPNESARRLAIRQQVGLRMLYLIADDPQRAQQAIPGASAAEQEFWTTLFQGLSEYLNDRQVTDPAERAAQTIAQLRTAAHHLQQQSYLEMRNVTFCERINSFGNYEPFVKDEFHPGQTVLIYSEVRNFSSEPTIDGFYRTLIRSTVEIYQGNEQGKLIDRTRFDPTEDLCRTLRSDYFHSYRIDLPGHLTPGPHVLKLTLQDDLSGKMATQTLSFLVK